MINSLIFPRKQHHDSSFPYGHPLQDKVTNLYVIVINSNIIVLYHLSKNNYMSEITLCFLDAPPVTPPAPSATDKALYVSPMSPSLTAEYVLADFCPSNDDPSPPPRPVVHGDVCVTSTGNKAFVGPAGGFLNQLKRK